MSRGVGIVLLLLALPAGASAQGALNDQQRVGQALFTQSCGVCHLKPQITANTYGPPLSKESAGGSEDVMRETITNGTPRMPGFKHTFEPAQIDVSDFHGASMAGRPVSGLCGGSAGRGRLPVLASVLH